MNDPGIQDNYASELPLKNGAGKLFMSELERLSVDAAAEAVATGTSVEDVILKHAGVLKPIHVGAFFDPGTLQPAVFRFPRQQHVSASVVAVVVVVGEVVVVAVVVAVVDVVGVVVATSAQHRIEPTSSSSPFPHRMLSGSISDARDGTYKCPLSHSSAAQMSCRSKLHPVPCTTS